MTEEEFKMRMEELAVDDVNVKLGDVQNLEHLSPWERNQIALHIHARHERPRHFLKWSTIQKTMFVGNAPYVEAEWGSLLQDALSPHRWSYKLTDPLIGRPVLSNIKADYNLDMSGNFIHQAHMLNEFELKSRIPTEDFDTIFEFGGGYGALCYIIHKLGFMGKYMLYDLPEMELIQQYYLENTIGGGVDIEWLELAHLLNAKSLRPAVYKNTIETDLFIANISLSETPIVLRRRLLNMVDAKHYYITFLPSHGGVGNFTYFDKYCKETADLIEWELWHNPHKTNIHYLYGRKKAQKEV